MQRIKNNFAEGLEVINLGMDPEDLRPLAWMRFVFIRSSPLQRDASYHY
jgi:hypothetical protein